MTYTVMIGNKMLNRSHCRGTFASLEEAQTFAAKEAARSRSFCTFQVYIGTPRNPVQPAKGSAQIEGTAT
jgi:hypothetical protein